MVNINAQEYINQKYPINGVCKSGSDEENKKRDEITILDLSKGKVGKGLLNNDGKTLIGSLKLEGFTKLRKLIISSQQITELDISECNNLIELDCQDNQIDKLNVTGCSSLKTVDCSNNYLKELDLSTCSKLDEVDINNCLSELIEEGAIKSNLVYDTENGKLIKGNSQKASETKPQIREAEENDIRNILVVGITGNGKSTLANVLTNTKEFKESSTSISVTKNFQTSDIFEYESKKYRVIDNIGFSDTNNISREDILFRIGDGIHEAEEGLNQVLFVFKDRFSKDQIIAFNLFKDFINETGITKFTTIVKTGFENFRTKQKCEDDKQILLTQTKGLSEIINSCNGLVYVNNPAIPTIEQDDDEETKEANEKIAKANKRFRERSRKIVLDHLTKNCSEIYKLKEWDSIYKMVENYNKRKEAIEKGSSTNKEAELKQAKTELAKKVDKTIKGSVGVSVPYLPVEFNLSGEYTTHIEIPPK